MKTASAAASGLVALIAAGTLSACDGATAADRPDNDPATAGSTKDAVVTVAFNDSSVPPPYHRSWEVTVGPDSVTMVVDSYGDVLARRTVPLAAADRAAFLDTLPDRLAAVGEDDVTAGPGCAGGTATELDVRAAGALDRHVRIDRCGEVVDVDRTAAIEAVVEPFRAELGLDQAIRTP